jgi:hypothetical protein
MQNSHSKDSIAFAQKLSTTIIVTGTVVLCSTSIATANEALSGSVRDLPVTLNVAPSDNLVPPPDVTPLPAIPQQIDPTVVAEDLAGDRTLPTSATLPTFSRQFTYWDESFLQTNQTIGTGLRELSVANNPDGSKPVAATQKKWGVGIHARAGTLGFFGLDAGYRFNNNVHARLGFNVGGVGTTYQNSGVDYNANLNLSNIHLLGDYYPFGGGLRLTGGFIVQNNRLTGTAKPSNSTYNINGTNYPAAAVGTIDANASFGSSFAPYLGIGFGSPISPGLGFNFDLGVMFPGSASATLTNSNPDPLFQASPAYQIFQQDLQAQQDKTNKDLSGFSVYPVLSIGLSYSF